MRSTLQRLLTAFERETEPSADSSTRTGIPQRLFRAFESETSYSARSTPSGSTSCKASSEAWNPRPRSPSSGSAARSPAKPARRLGIRDRGVPGHCRPLSRHCKASSGAWNPRQLGRHDHDDAQLLPATAARSLGIRDRARVCCATTRSLFLQSQLGGLESETLGRGSRQPPLRCYCNASSTAWESRQRGSSGARRPRAIRKGSSGPSNRRLAVRCRPGEQNSGAPVRAAHGLRA